MRGASRGAAAWGGWVGRTAVAAAVALAATSASAATYVMGFSGFTNPSLADPLGGTAVSGTLSYTDAVSDSNGSSAFGTYANAIVGGSVTVGPTTWTLGRDAIVGDAETLKVTYGPPTLFQTLEFKTGLDGASVGGLEPSYANITLNIVDENNPPLSSDAVPTSIDGSKFTGRTLTLYFGSPAIQEYDIRLVTVMAPVPEPQEWAMLGVGLAVVGLVARRRRVRDPNGQAG